MNKLLLILFLLFYSFASLAKIGDVYFCDMKQNMNVGIESTISDEVYKLSIFKFKWEKNNIKIISEGDWYSQIPQEYLFYPIIYQYPEAIDANGNKYESFSAQGDFGTIIYNDDSFLYLGQGELKQGYVQPFGTQIRTAICKIY